MQGQRSNGMAKFALPLSSHRPDIRVVLILGVLQRIALIIIAVVAGITLCTWLVPFLHNLLPAGWEVMKANTAAVALLSGLGILLSQPGSSANSIKASRLLGAFVSLLCLATISEYLFHISLGLDTLLAADPHTLMPGRMSIQSAVSFAILGVLLVNLRARKRPLAYLVDSLTLCLALLMLVFTAGYIFGAIGLFGLSMQHRLSPQTLLCLVLLSFLVFNRRTEYGFFSIMIDDGIGGKTARLGAPVALFLPFTLATIRGIITRANWVPEQYGIALAAALMALISFSLVLYLSVRCKHLESVGRELSLRDHLTQLYNRRGFYLLAELTLKLAYRSRDTFFLIYIDMDNLKQINDNIGHEAGSQLLQEMAALLEETFRTTDAMGRIGGDEFVIAGACDPVEIVTIVKRLEDAAIARNAMPSRRYPFSFSLGYITSHQDSAKTIEALMQEADSIMYQAKRAKKHHRHPIDDIETVSMLPAQHVVEDVASV
jgi:diguanylate cyclase (GGDEF)-like protein